MKNMILILVMMIPLAGFSQWTQQQQDEYRKQMDEFRIQMDQQMQQLRDSLALIQKQMNNEDWSTFDTSNWRMPEMMEIPEMPEMPEMPESPSYSYGYLKNFPAVKFYTNNDDTTEVRWGKWHVVVHENDGNDNVRVYKSDEDCCDDGDDYNSWDNSMHNVETKFLLLDIGVNNYFGPSFSSTLPGYEWFEPNPENHG
jgi:hypothetical protein